MQAYASDIPTGSRGRRVVWASIAIVALAAMAFHAAGGWLVASWIGAEISARAGADPVDDGAVIDLEGDRATIRQAAGADADLELAGVIGFETESAYIRLGEVIEVVGRDVTRTFELMEGSEPDVGAFGDLDVTARPVSDLEELGLHRSTYQGPLGPMQAWSIDGNDTWVIHVHDHAREPEQAFRTMAILARDGVSQMSITYRNDPGQPADPDRRFTFGITERDDLAAAVAHARESGATTVLLAGYGSGASIVMAEVYRDLGITGLILDGPVLDAESSVRFQATNTAAGLVGSAPATVSAFGAIVASLRFGISWDTVDYLSRIDQLTAPVLILHGGADTEHPIDDSRAAAERRPELVRLVEIDDAGPDLSWNVDPRAYESAVLEFMAGARTVS